MNALTSTAKPFALPVHFRRGIEGSQPEALIDIYQEDTNIVIWQRRLTTMLTEAAEAIILSNPALQTSMVVSPQDADATVKQTLGFTPFAAILSEDIAHLIDMFCCLFDLKRVGLRLTALDRAMCPRFHVDRVPCRLVTTYQGVASEWLPDSAADRSKLGTGSKGQPDEQSGIYQNISDIRHLSQGEVALLKGDLWDGNEGGGLVHRSPDLSTETRRLLLTLDFIDD